MSCREVTAKDLLDRETSSSYRPIPTFIQSLDELLGGGIKPGLITEIVGDTGLGKTTFCIQLCLDVQISRLLTGLESHALYIDTENSFVDKRVREMAKCFVSHCNSVIPKEYGTKIRISEKKVMNGIHLVKCKDYSTLEKIIVSLDDFISRNRKIRLIVIDSIAYPYYTQRESFWSRGKPLYSMGQVLHYLAERYGIAVVVTNKLTTRFNDKTGEYYVPFLGESWYHIPNQRISLYWGNQGRVRTAEIVKAYALQGPGIVNYKVTSAGIRE